MLKIGDIDIDVKTDFDPIDYFPWTKASTVAVGELKPHPCGVHPQTIPIDPLTGLSAIPYELAEEYDYTKIDFLHLNLYNKFKDRNEMLRYLSLEPDWNYLLLPQFQIKLFQLARHGAVLNELKPKSIQEVSEVLALIRPGKSGLLQLYKKDKNLVREVLWEDNGSGYYFKKSHATCYAMVLVLQLHLFELGRL